MPEEKVGFVTMGEVAEAKEIKEVELAFLRRHRDKLPDEIVREGKPFNLTS